MSDHRIVQTTIHKDELKELDALPGFRTQHVIRAIKEYLNKMNKCAKDDFPFFSVETLPEYEIFKIKDA